MNTISASVNASSIIYTISNKQKSINSDIILIIFNGKGTIIYSTHDILMKELYNILFYTNNNCYILIIQRKKQINNDQILSSLFFYDDIKRDDICVVLYKKTDNKYNILSSVSSYTIIEFHYNIPFLLSTDMNVLCILDEFSYNCFKYECNLIPIDFTKWVKQIALVKPNMLFVESVWNAVGSRFTFSTPLHINTLTNIINYCSYNNIPTIFWNKEDDIKYNHFLKFALMFDIILTTDIRCVPRYKTEQSNKKNIVDCLEFACQPMIHNPLNQSREKDVFFAGRWYTDYPERNLQIENLINIPEFKNEYHLDIFDRYFVDVSSFPSKYSRMVKPKLTYAGVNQVANNYKIMFNVNTITESNTMFSRRVYEGLASGCCIISTMSVGIETKFKDIVYISKNMNDTTRLLKHILNDSMTEHLSFLSHRSVIKTDNYKVRFKKILDIAKISYDNDDDSLVSVISYYTGLNTQDTLRHFIKCILNQSYINCVITIFVETDDIMTVLTKLFKNDNILFVLVNNEEYTMEIMKNIYIAKLDINASYDNNYISDSLLPFLYIDPSIKKIGGVDRYSYNYISDPSEYATFYRK